MKLTGKIIAILVAEGVEDLEYYVPLMRLQEEDATVLTAAVELKSVTGKNGLVVTPDTTIESLNPELLDGLVIPGGWAPDKRSHYNAVTDLVRNMDEAAKPIGDPFSQNHPDQRRVENKLIAQGDNCNGSAGR